MITMWAVLRASSLIKAWASTICIPSPCCASLEAASGFLDEREDFYEPSHPKSLRCLFLKRYYHSTCIPFYRSRWRCNFSSQGFASSSSSSHRRHDDHDDDDTHDEFISGLVFSEDDQQDSGNLQDTSQFKLGLSGIKVDLRKTSSKSTAAPTDLFKFVTGVPVHSIPAILDKWIEDGRDLTRDDVFVTMGNLRRDKLYDRALQFFEWLHRSGQLDFDERDYATLVDLIAKVHGAQMAEAYIDNIPGPFRGEVPYRSLLASFVSSNNMKKAEETFNKMRDLGFPMSCFACDQLLLLYRRADKRKIPDVLLLMEKENVKPSLFTYGMLISSKGESNDMAGMHRLVVNMMNEGFEPDELTLCDIAKYYLSGGFKDRAEDIIKKIERGNLEDNHRARQALFPLYAALGMGDSVKRLWEVCRSNPWLEEAAAAIQAWGKLNDIKEAEAILDEMPTYRCYSAMLNVYADRRMLMKGKELVRRMVGSGCRAGPHIWNALVKLYVAVGEVETADSMLERAARKSRETPMFVSYMMILEKYAVRGDVRNCEKICWRIREGGYASRRVYETLAKAYLVAKVPVYGLRERIVADNVCITRSLQGLLQLVDGLITGRVP